jgi:hypothetical protein
LAVINGQLLRNPQQLYSSSFFLSAVAVAIRENYLESELLDIVRPTSRQKAVIGIHNE